MTRVRVKVCGITRPEDAAGCAALGADFLGLIFAPSPRRVTVARAREVRAAAPDARWVGVFVDAPLEVLLEQVTATGIEWVQLHGREPDRYRAALRARGGVRIVRAVTAGDGAAVLSAEPAPGGETAALGAGPDPRRRERTPRARAPLAGADYLLLDLPKGVPASERDRRRSALWREAARYERRGDRLFLAGGLTPRNVGEAIAAVGPYAVDVASGVEREPGIKDMAKVGAFLKEVAACQ